MGIEGTAAAPAGPQGLLLGFYGEQVLPLNGLGLFNLSP